MVPKTRRYWRGNMKTTVEFLAEWAEKEAWKIHVYNKVTKKGILIQQNC